MIFFIILIFIILIWLFWRYIYFGRDPERIIPQGNNILSAADGTIVYIKKIDNNIIPISIKETTSIELNEILSMNKELINGPKYIVGVFMHPTSVHINRSPIKGIVKDIKYISNNRNLPMTFMWWRVLLGLKPYEKYSEHILKNERNIMHILGNIPLIVIQIADIYVNKIVTFVKLDENIQGGQRIGMIKMGSQVDIIFPNNDKIIIKVNEGDKVKAGQTIIAEY